MASDMVIDNYRRSNIRSNYEQSMVIDIDTPLSPDEVLAYNELVLKYTKSLEEMPDKQRVVLLMNRNDLLIHIW